MAHRETAKTVNYERHELHELGIVRFRSTAGMNHRGPQSLTEKIHGGLRPGTDRGRLFNPSVPAVPLCPSVVNRLFGCSPWRLGVRPAVRPRFTRRVRPTCPSSVQSVKPRPPAWQVRSWLFRLSDPGGLGETALPSPFVPTLQEVGMAVGLLRLFRLPLCAPLCSLW